METCTLGSEGGRGQRCPCPTRLLHENLAALKVCQNVISEWLSHYDLELKPSKTKVVHTLNELDKNQPGFNFLGFNIRQYKVGKYQSGKNGQGKLLGFKTVIRPSSDSVRRHYNKISETIGRLKAAPQEKIISELNPIIRGWCNYYRTVCSQETYSKLGFLTHKRLRKWANRRHPNKGKYWVGDKYWTTIGGDNWVFGKEYKDDKITLERHTKTAISRHVKVRGNKTPYDGDTIYWAKRKGSHPELKPSTAKLLKKQNGKCNWCNLNFLDGDLIDTDHITPKQAGGNNSQDNLQLLHKHCHDAKTKSDLLVIKLYKAKKSGEKTQKWFNNLDWNWVDDIPTLLKVGTQTEPEKRGAQ